MISDENLTSSLKSYKTRGVLIWGENDTFDNIGHTKTDKNCGL